MKKKIKDISNREMNKICKDHIKYNCENCPLKRFDKKTGREKLLCYKKARALYYADKEIVMNTSGMTDENKLLIIERYKKEQEEIEKDEIEL